MNEHEKEDFRKLSKQLHKIADERDKLQAKNKALEEKLEEEQKEMIGECVWVEDAGVDTDGIYYTECHNSFYIIDGTPQDNNFKYCPYCGKILKEKQK